MGRASPASRSPYSSRTGSVDPAIARRRRLVLPQEICRPVVTTRLRESRDERTGRQKSAEGIVRAEQRVDREGSSPSGARMRSAVSKSGGNSSLAGKSGRYAFTYASVERPKRARRRKPETDQGGPGATAPHFPEGIRFSAFALAPGCPSRGGIRRA